MGREDRVLRAFVCGFLFPLTPCVCVCVSIAMRFKLLFEMTRILYSKNGCAQAHAL